MSETNSPTITRSEKTQVEKNPQKVEAGKRLGAISKAAKERKARERLTLEARVEDSAADAQSQTTGIMICVGVVAGLGGLYDMHTKGWFKGKPEADAKVNPEKVNVKPQLDSFDD